MFKKIIAAIAVAACFAFLAPQAASAETKSGGGTTAVVATTESGRATTRTVDQINTRVATDAAYAEQLATAVTEGDLKAVSQLFEAEGAVVESVVDEVQTNLVVQVRFKVCFTYGGVRYCATVTITVEL